MIAWRACVCVCVGAHHAMAYLRLQFKQFSRVEERQRETSRRVCATPHTIILHQVNVYDAK